MRQKKIVWGTAIAGISLALLIILAAVISHTVLGLSSSQASRGTSSSMAHARATKTISTPGMSFPVQSKPTVFPTATPLPPVAVGNGVTSNLQVSAATYLGVTSSTTTSGIDVAPDHSIVFAGMLPGYSVAGASAHALLGGGNGTVVRFDSTGRTVLSVTHIGGVVDDLQVSANGTIATCGDFGVAALDSTATNVLWSANPGNGARCTIGDDGTVAVLVGSIADDLVGGGSAYVYNASGSLLAHWLVAGSSQTDITLDAADQLVIASGFTQYGMVQIPFLRAWNYSGSLVWTDYDFTPAQATSQALAADTRAYRVRMGRDNKLYMAGEGAGGGNMFSRNPKAVDQLVGGAQLVSGDIYTNPYNTGSNHITWYGRYDPANGNLLMGQYLLTRLPNTKGNTIRPRAIMADQSGRVYLGGSACAFIANRDGQRIAGAAVGVYSGCESFLLIVQPDLRQRLVWTVFSGAGAGQSSVVYGVSVRDGVAAVGIALRGGTLLTANAVQNQISGAYMAAWTQTVE